MKDVVVEYVDRGFLMSRGFDEKLKCMTGLRLPFNMGVSQVQVGRPWPLVGLV